MEWAKKGDATKTLVHGLSLINLRESAPTSSSSPLPSRQLVNNLNSHWLIRPPFAQFPYRDLIRLLPKPFSLIDSIGGDSVVGSGLIHHAAALGTVRSFNIVFKHLTPSK